MMYSCLSKSPFKNTRDVTPEDIHTGTCIHRLTQRVNVILGKRKWSDILLLYSNPDEHSAYSSSHTCMGSHIRFKYVLRLPLF